MDTLFDIIFWVGIIWWAFDFLIRLRQEADLRNRIRHHLDEKIRVVRLEPYENLLLAYDGENNQFLGQGHNEDELKQNIMTRFPDKIFLMNEKPFSAAPINVPDHI